MGCYAAKVSWLFTNLKYLCREFEILTMGENEMVDEYFARTLPIANQMTAQ